MSSRDEVVDLAAALVGQPSENPPGNEAPVATVLEERFRSSPIDYEVTVTDVEPGRPNVVARAGDPDGGSVLLTGHTDVVPASRDDWNGDPFEPRIVDDRLIGRGTADMKGAIAAQIVAAEAYAADDPAGEVVLAFAVDEERDGAGTNALVDAGIDADVAILGEPTELDVCTAQKGSVWYRIEIRGERAHAGTPDRATSAATGLGRLLGAIDDLDADRRENTAHDLLSPETVTVTEVESGSAPNVVPGEAVVTVDWRLLPGENGTGDPDSVLSDFLSAVASARGLDVTFERIASGRPAEVDPETKPVRVLRRAATEITDRGAVGGFDAWTDLPVLAIDGSIPTVLFGPGSITDAHTVEESVPISELHDAARVYRSFLDRWLG
ncbi:M20 family metallopeptidase [Halosolutus amylolyticus]|uniref:Probable succinyl-diaminopimelate desuccinylase n=1 Tax=Halosolutus amylolyticus TaxID=2932267 RepID=A0ABD5PJC3_9EURY|nr:M20 family metallopeptidase [Halosolutus amylolyticus]